MRDLVVRSATALAVGTVVELLRRQAQRQLNPSVLADWIEALVRRQEDPVVPNPMRMPFPMAKPAASQLPIITGNRPGTVIFRYSFFRRIQFHR